MERRAIDAAKLRLESARSAVSILQDKKTMTEQAQSAWIDFLIAAGAIYSKLEQGAKSKNKSQEWFGKIKHIRKTDELLCYIHHARNSEEHGLDGSSAYEPPKLEAVPGDQTTIIPATEQEPERVLHRSNEPGSLKVKITMSKLRLVAVKDDRYGDIFPLPKTHLGKTVPSMPLGDFASLALRYLEGLVQEADLLTQ